MPEPHASIAVLPFADPAGAPDTEHLATGFAEELVAQLTRFTPLRVVAAASGAALGLAGPAVAEAARSWGLDYLLEGSVRVHAQTLRVAARLVRVDGMRVVWAERFDAPLEEILVVQDGIAAAVAGQLAVRIQGERLARARRLSPDELAVHDLWLRGMACLEQGTLEGDEESRSWFGKALALDPSHARSHAGLSVSHFNEWSCQAWHLWDESPDNAFVHATKAAALDGTDAVVQAVLARVHRYRHQHAQADACAARALELNPNDAYVLIQVSLATLFQGDAEGALALADKAMRHHPAGPPWYAGTAGWCRFMAGRPDEGLPLLERGGMSVVNFGAYRAASHALLGDRARARAELEAYEREYRDKIAFGREPEPGEALAWALRVEPFRRPEDSARLPDALRAAGLADLDVAGVLADRRRHLVRPADIARPDGCVFRREDGTWALDYEGTGARLLEVKGFHDLARLLAEPDTPVHCLELSGAPPERGERQVVLDAQARRAYRQRYEELEADLEDAERGHDLARAEALRAERDRLVDELARATGLRGRDRALGDRAERARSAVTWRIRSAIKKIRAAHPRLGQHLANSIRTGTFCSYAPETPIRWAL